MTSAPHFSSPEFSGTFPRGLPCVQKTVLPGCCRGLVFYQWATRVEARWGHLVREEIEEQLREHDLWVPDDPMPRRWYPVAAQLMIVDNLLEGPLQGCEERVGRYLFEDVSQDIQGVMAHLLRGVGAAGLLRQGQTLWSRLYDFGTLEVEARRRWVRLRYLGAPVFGTHTWRVLQRGVVETVLQFSGVDSFFIDQEMVDDENLTLTVRW